MDKEIDNIEALLKASGNGFNPIGIECPYCKGDVDITELIKKVKEQATQLQRAKDLKDEIEFLEEVYKARYKEWEDFEDSWLEIKVVKRLNKIKEELKRLEK